MQTRLWQRESRYTPLSLRRLKTLQNTVSDDGSALRVFAALSQVFLPVLQIVRDRSFSVAPVLVDSVEFYYMHYRYKTLVHKYSPGREFLLLHRNRI